MSCCAHDAKHSETSRRKQPLPGPGCRRCGQVILANWRQLQGVAMSSGQGPPLRLIEELDRARDQVDRAFRRIEALRMNLPKHEIKGRKQLAIGPGYARFYESTGSLIRMVDLGDNNCDMFNRRDFADELRVAVISHVMPEDELEITKNLNQKRKRDAASLCPCAGVNRLRRRLKNSRRTSKQSFRFKMPKCAR